MDDGYRGSRSELNFVSKGTRMAVLDLRHNRPHLSDASRAMANIEVAGAMPITRWSRGQRCWQLEAVHLLEQACHGLPLSDWFASPDTGNAAGSAEQRGVMRLRP